MAKIDQKQRAGLVRFDPEKVRALLIRHGLSKTKLAEKTGVARQTIISALDEKGVFPATAKLIASGLGVEDPNALLRNEQAAADIHADQLADSREWQVENYRGQWIKTSNGLQFRICDMRHRYVPSRRGRGKWYDLLNLSSGDRESLRSHLVRHPTVCERIGQHPHVATNLSTAPSADQKYWWVIDRWIDGATLEAALGDRPLPEAKLSHLMWQIALGLDALHRVEVVFRELAPSRVLLAAADERAVLTDFELAKLMGSGPTVSTEWPEDPYRAPEVESGEVDVRADLYSWARILLRAASGELPAKGQDADAVTRVGLPKPVWRMATDCLSPQPSERPKSVRQLLRVASKWAKS